MNTMRHTILGAAFFTALVTLGFLTIYLGSFDFGKSQALTVYFEDVAGLRAGNLVLAHGVEVGKVRSIAFSGSDDPSQRLQVELSLEKDVPLRADCEVRIADQSLLGGRQVEILTGTTGVHDASRPLLGSGRSDPLSAIHRAVGGENGDRIGHILDNLDQLTTAIAKGESTLLEYVLSDAARADLDGTLAAARNIAQKVDQGENSLGKLINSSTLHDDLSGFLGQGRELLDLVAKGEGTIGKLVTEDGIYQKLESIGTDLQTVVGRVKDGEGLLGKLTGPGSDEIYEDLRAIATDARKVSADLANQEGVLGRLVHDPEWAARLDTVLTDLEAASGGIGEVVAMVREGRGVLGYLVADDQARREVQKIVGLVAGALEDAREAAPVSSVASFLFGQF